MTKLVFTPYSLGSVELKNRIIMAPLTRMRAPNTIANELMATYYAQRASAGLIISEASQISPQGVGYPATPGIYSAEQVEGWKKVTSAVHAQGGKIFCQLWHVGRISHPDFHGGDAPVAPSAITPMGNAITPTGLQPFVQPRALATEDIAGIIETYRLAAQHALQAGFDGVEIHSANGYLLDQFLRDGTNHRTDNYGGVLANRVRLLLDVTEAVISVCGADKTAVRLSPSGTFNDMRDTNPDALFTYVLAELSAYKLAYVHIVDALESDIRHGAKVVELATLRAAYTGTLMVCGGYDYARAEQVLVAGLAELVAFGQLYIANPDLLERFRVKAELNKADPSSFYGGTAQGYTDYPALLN